LISVCTDMTSLLKDMIALKLKENSLDIRSGSLIWVSKYSCWAYKFYYTGSYKPCPIGLDISLIKRNPAARKSNTHT